MMKKNKIVILSAALLCGFYASPQEITVGNIQYDVVQFVGYPTKEAVVIGFRDGYTPTGALSFPTTIPYEGSQIPVVGLGYSSFAGQQTLQPVVGNFDGITSVRIPRHMRFIGDNEFIGCPSITSYEVEAGSEDFKSVNGALCEAIVFDENRWRLFRYPSGKTSPTYAVPAEAESVCMAAFASNKSLRKVYLSGTQALRDGWQIDNKSIQEIDCSNHRQYRVGDDGAIYWGQDLEAVCPGRSYDTFTVPETVRYVGSGAFCNSSVRKIVIPADVEWFTGTWTYGYSDVEEIEYSCPTPYDIGESCFRGCRNLKSFSLGASSSGLLDLGYCCFMDCESLTTLTISPEVKTLKLRAWAFDGCRSLTAFPLTSKMKIPTLGERAFAGCESMESFLFSTVGEFQESGYQFAGSGLKQAHWPTGIKHVPRGCFSDCKNLTKVNLKMTTTDLNSEAFKGSGLVALNLAGVEWYYGNTFNDCPDLMRLYFPAHEEGTVRYNPVAFKPEGSQVIVNNPSIRHLEYQTKEMSENVSLYLSAVNGGMEIGDGWQTVYVPGRCAGLYRQLTPNPVEEMFSYDTYPQEGAVAVKALVAGVRVTSVTIEGKETTLVNGKFVAEGVTVPDDRMNVTVNYTVGGNPMTSTYEYAYSDAPTIGEDLSGEQPSEWYTLQGARVSGDNLPTGIYIRRQGDRTEKIHIR